MPQAVIDAVLGLVQGLTEFLPVSSSGHLVVVPALFGWDDPSVSFDLLLHVATLGAVIVYFRRDLWDMTKGLAGRGDDPVAARRMVSFLIIGTVPAAIAGLGFEDFFEGLFDEPLWVCAFWVVTAGILVVGERIHRSAPARDLTVAIAFVIGAAQAMALVPGISRAGATIVTGLALGLSRTEAARFAFLLSIPAIGGGGLTLIPDVIDGSFDITGPVLLGCAVAALSGYAAVAGLLRLVRTRSLAPFAGYLVVVAPAAAIAL